MRRLLLSPRWLAGHVFVAVCFVGFLRLGWWQWDRAHDANGGLQNLGYALQWPLFAGFAVFAWVKMVRLEAARLRGDAPAATDAGVTDAEVTDPTEASAGPAQRPAWHYEPPTVDDDDEDEELAAYNRRLAALHAQDTARDGERQ